MSVLSFPCVVTHHDGANETHRRRTWIKGHNLYALALAATEQLAVRVEECAYKLFIPEVLHSTGVLLEVVHAGHSALVGPMAGPTPPLTMNQGCGYALPQLGTRSYQILLDHPIAKLEARRPNAGARVLGGVR